MRVGLVVSVLQTGALAVAAVLTGSAALVSQTATSLADVAASGLLLVGVISSGRAADDRQPLGYGRERFFWSFLAALVTFVGGFGVAMAETVRAYVDPRPVGAFTLGLAVLVATVLLDAVTLRSGSRALQQQAARRRTSFWRLLWTGTDPAVTTVVLTGAAGVAGGLLALLGLVGREVTGLASVDATASLLISLVLLATSVVLLHTNRELLTGRGLPRELTERMRAVIAQQPGVEAVADLFAVVVGPSSLILDADVVFDDDLDVPEVERTIVQAAEALRAQWPSLTYIYVNPVAAARQRGRT